MSTDDDDDRTVIRPQTQMPGAAPAPQQQRTQLVPPPAPASSASSAASSAGDSGNALPMGTYLAEFELQQVLGEGGFGIVYQAWDHSLERKVALKEYMPASLASRNDGTTVQVRSERHRETFEAGRKSFINEAKLLASFDHPSLVKVYRFWEANGTAYMVMPLYEGITLKDWLKGRSEPPDEAWLLTMLEPLTAALAVIHAESCFHRDIAPDNVILLGGRSHRPLLLDFGAARRVIGDMTQALTVILKPGYAPVEQYAEAPHMKQGGWTDVYALAASIHFCLLGKTPPPSVSRMMSDTYEPLMTRLAGRYSEGFLFAIDRALLVKPEERTQSIEQMRSDFGFGPVGSASNAQQGSETRFGQSSSFAPSAFGQTQLSPPASATSAPDAEPARSRMPLIAGAAALVIGGGGLAAWLALRPAAPAPAPVTASAAPAPAPVVQQAPAAAPVPQRFDPLAQFERVLAAQDASYGVRAVAGKSSLRIGKDFFTFSVTAARAGYVQVLLLGPDGSLLQLFPNAKAPAQRINAGQTIKLPGNDWPLEASDPTGTEHVLVIVSQEPRDYSSLGLEAADIFQGLPTGAKADTALNSWTRPTPMLLGAAPASCQGANCDAFGATSFSVEVVR